MFEAIGTFLGAWVLTGWGLGLLLLLGVMFEHNQSRVWAVIAAIATLIVAFFTYHVSLLTIVLYTVGYIFIGVLWSVYRYKRHVMKVVAENIGKPDSTKQFVLSTLHPKAMLGTLTAWIIVWPFSFVENVAGDLINSVQLLVSKVFKGMYHRIYDSAVAALTK